MRDFSQKLKVEDAKMKFSCETSLKIARGRCEKKLSCETSLKN